MKYRLLLITSLISSTSFLVSCDKKEPVTSTENAATSQISIAKNIPTDKWLGKWIGPEGTFLQLSGGDGKYDIIIQDLDGPKTFSGESSGTEIQFERSGIKETIHATNGEGTGMKWLSEKSDCLTIKPGEGYCRD